MSEQVGWRALESQGGHLTRVSKPGPRGKSSVWGWCCPRHVSPICLLLGSGQILQCWNQGHSHEPALVSPPPQNSRQRFTGVATLGRGTRKRLSVDSACHVNLTD